MKKTDWEYCGKIVEQRPFKQLNGRVSYSSYTQADLDREENDKKRKRYEDLRTEQAIKMVHFCRAYDIAFELTLSRFLKLKNKTKIPMLLDEFGRTHLTYDTIADIEDYEHEFPAEVLETEGWRNT